MLKRSFNGEAKNGPKTKRKTTTRKKVNFEDCTFITEAKLGSNEVAGWLGWL